MAGMTMADRRARGVFLLTGGVAGAVALGVFAAGLVPTHSTSGLAPDSLSRYRSDGMQPSGDTYYIESGPQDLTPQPVGARPDGYYASAYPFPGRGADGAGDGGYGTGGSGEIPLDTDLAALSDPVDLLAPMDDGAQDGGQAASGSRSSGNRAGEAAIAAAAVARAVRTAEAGLKPVATVAAPAVTAEAL